MSDSNLPNTTPDSETSLVPVEKAPITKQSGSLTQAVAGNSIYDILRNGVPYIVSQITTLLAFMQGWSWPLIILAGAGVFLVLTIAFVAIATYMERRKLAQKPLALTNVSQVKERCPDKWLHEIADTQKKSIQSHVLIREYRIQHHNLLRESPFIDFNFVVFNASVYTISLDKVSGSISYGGQLLAETPILTGDSVKSLSLGQTGNCVIRQPLSRDDAAYILSMEAQFSFEKLKIKIEAAPNSANVEPQYLKLPPGMSHEKLYAAYPKLNIEIQQVQLKGLWHLDKPEEAFSEGDLIGSVINIQVRFENPRYNRAVNIQSFKLDTNPQVPRITSAEKGEIYELPHFKGGTPLNNLNQCPIHAEQGHPFEGWLQFILSGVQPESLSRATPRLVIVDLSGEEHRQGVSPLIRG